MNRPNPLSDKENIKSIEHQTGVITWFAKNPIAANLLMILIVVAGLFSAINISKQMFPTVTLPSINITAFYPGAAPVEIETSVILPIESVLRGMNGIKKITSNASRDFASVRLDIESDQNIDDVLTQVENRISSITHFPADLEKPNIKKSEVLHWVTQVAVSGVNDEGTRKILGQEIRDELLALPDIKQVTLWGVNQYEIAIEVEESKLRAFDLTLGDIAAAVRQSSLNLSAGVLKTENGYLLLRTEGQARVGDEFNNIVVRHSPDGTQLLLADIAQIDDSFVESNHFVRFDQTDAFAIGVFARDKQSLLVIDESVEQYINAKRKTLPNVINIDKNFSASYYLEDRIDMMVENLFLGALLVAIVLTLFLNLTVAMWVMIGIPVSFLGALWLMPSNPFYPVNINMLSLFAFIMVLGIVVDDAIIIGESIFSVAKKQKKLAIENGGNTDIDYVCTEADVIAGAKKVALPSTIGVLTTVAAFIPILFVGGTSASFFESIAVVVTLCLLFSLIESKLILPAHLVGLKITGDRQPRFKFLNNAQKLIASRLSIFIEEKYQPFLKRCLAHRYLTIASFIGVLIVAISLFINGIVRFEFFPNVPNDDIRAKIVMQDGISPELRRETVLKVESAAYRINEYYQEHDPDGIDVIKHVVIWTESDTAATLVVSLNTLSSMNSIEFEKLWRNEVGNLPGVRQQNFSATTNPGGGSAINLALSGSSPTQLTNAGNDLQKKLAEYDGVYNIYNSQGAGGREVIIRLKPYADQLDIRLVDVAAQVRQAFYGEEVQRIQRKAETFKVMVRYPLAARRSIETLETMHIRSSTGERIAIGDVADIQFVNSINSISRIDGKRTVSISADVDTAKLQSNLVIDEIIKEFIPELLKKYPAVQFGLGGASQEQIDTQQRMLVSFLAALFMIYALLAIPLRSYLQPLIIMSVIPFGFIGAVVGHLVFGLAISMLSLFGLIALAGVVVNDSLILVDFANRERNNGQTLDEAILSAGRQRFRAIILTTLTTFFGLLPILFETSLQAQFVIPMALSISFGIVFSTAITLILIPCLYRVLGDFKRKKEAVA